MVTGLRNSGASIGSATAFFLANPALNPAVLVFLVLTPGLGWSWALLRLTFGLLLVFGSAALVNRLVPTPVPAQSLTEERVDLESAKQEHVVVRWLKSFAILALTLVPEYIVMILLLGAARAFLFPAAGPELGNSPLIIVGLAVVGMLFAIPTAGEIPIIQTMRAFGMGDGPSGALLLTLAPASLPSLLMLSRVFPKRVLAVIALAVVAAGVLAGLAAVVLDL